MNNLKHLVVFAAIFIVLNLIGTSCKPDALPTKPPTPAKSYVACFVNGQPVFSGEAIGPAKVVDVSVVTFYSIELDAEVRIVNGGCIEVKKGWQAPTQKASSPHDGAI